MHLIIKNYACYNIMSVIASLIATYKRYALVIYMPVLVYEIILPNRTAEKTYQSHKFLIQVNCRSNLGFDDRQTGMHTSNASP